MTRVLTNCCIPLLLVAAGKLSAEPLPAGDFFRNHEITAADLSPDGRFVAMLAYAPTRPDARNLFVFELANGSANPVTALEDADIRWFFWANNDRLVMKIDQYFDDPDKPGRYLGTYSIHRNGTDAVRLHEPYLGDRKGRGGPGESTGGERETAFYLSDLPGDRENILLTVYDRRSRFPDVDQININTGNKKRLVTNFSNVIDWIVDNKGQVRAAIDAGDDPNDLIDELLVRSTGGGDWKSLLKFANDEFHVFGFAADNKHLWVASRIGRDKYALYYFDPATGDFGETVFEDKVYDIVHNNQQRVVGLVLSKEGDPYYLQYMRDKPDVIFFTEEWSKLQGRIDNALPDTVNTIVDWDDNQKHYLVHAWSDREAGQYFAYDAGKQTLRYLFAEAAWLDAGDMSEMRPIQFEARDGVTLHGYLTIPAGAPEESLPLILHPHGGPYGIRDEWGFDPHLQFLASRGYAVLQVNFRGSGGYGRKHLTSGYRQWGLLMQDDLTDAVHWAIEEGIANPEQICIYGASYGGYAVMMGLIDTPELYSCGINYVGVIDLELLYDESARITHEPGRPAFHTWFQMVIGDPDRDRQRFAATSPVNHIEKIQAPLLIIYGRVDDRVGPEHYRRLISELEKHDKPYRKLIKRHEGHGFFAPENNVELYEAIEQFLAENL